MSIKEEVLKELWGFDESAKDDESLSFDYDDVVDAIDLTQQKMIEDEIKFLEKNIHYSCRCITKDKIICAFHQRLEELKSQVEKGK